MTDAARLRVVILTLLPQVAQSYAEILTAAGHDTVAVISLRRVRPDTPALPFGSQHVENDPPNMDVLFAAKRRSLAPLLRAYEPDLAVCFGFPWLIPADAIEAPRLGILNAHPSLLPRYRGPYPIAWAIRNGEPEIGLSYHLMDAEFDTGNLLAQKAIPLDPEETGETLRPKIAAAATELLPGVLARLQAGDRGDAQQGDGDYQSGFEEAFSVIDPTWGAADIHRQVRAWSFTPPIPGFGAYLDGRHVRRTSLTEVDGAERLACADGPLWILDADPA